MIERAKPLCAPLPLAPAGVAPVARPLLGRRSKVGLVRTLGGSNGERERVPVSNTRIVALVALWPCGFAYRYWTLGSLHSPKPSENHTPKGWGAK